MADLVVQVQPTTLNGNPISNSLTTITVAKDDVIGFQIIGTVSVAGDSGVTNIKGSLVQLLATVTPGTWNTEVKGTLTAGTLTTEFNYNNPTTAHGGAISQDINADGFALDTGSTASASGSYVIGQYTVITSHATNGDVIGNFTYTVTDTLPSSAIPTVLNWKFATAGAANGKASWWEAGVNKNSSTVGAVYGAGTAINLVVPEPSTLIMLSMGALALLLFRRRK